MTPLQRDIAAQLGVGGAIDLAHAAFSNEGGDVVVPEAGSDGQGHVSVYPVESLDLIETATLGRRATSDDSTA